MSQTITGTTLADGTLKGEDTVVPISLILQSTRDNQSVVEM